MESKLFEEFKRLSESPLVNGGDFPYFASTAIKQGLVKDYSEYYWEIHNLKVSGLIYETRTELKIMNNTTVDVHYYQLRQNFTREEFRKVYNILKEEADYRGGIVTIDQKLLKYRTGITSTAKIMTILDELGDRCILMPNTQEENCVEYKFRP